MNARDTSEERELQQIDKKFNVMGVSDKTYDMKDLVTVQEPRGTTILQITEHDSDEEFDKCASTIIAEQLKKEDDGNEDAFIDASITAYKALQHVWKNLTDYWSDMPDLVPTSTSMYEEILEVCVKLKTSPMPHWRRLYFVAHFQDHFLEHITKEKVVAYKEYCKSIDAKIQEEEIIAWGEQTHDPFVNPVVVSGASIMTSFSQRMATSSPARSHGQPQSRT